MKYSAIIILLSVVILGCSPELIVKKMYEGDLSKISIMLIFPEELDAVNTKSGMDLESVSDEVYDSLFYAADFLPYIYRDSFLLDFKQSVISYLESENFNVYTEDNWTAFLRAKQPSYLFNFTYLQLEEHYTTFLETHISSKIMESGKPAVFVKLVNTLSLNAWIEYSYVQDTLSQTYSYFTNTDLSDKITGRFVEVEDSKDYIYDIDSLTLERALQLDTIAGKEIGNTSIDFLINQTLESTIGFIYERYPEYYLDFYGKGDIRKSDTSPNYIFLGVE